jgi:tRNA threonylcarbamoyladenosine biosynthesis protein TsaB
MISLAIDASTYRGTVAILRDGSLAVTAETAMRGAHSEGLMPAVASALAAAGIAHASVDRVICGAGPGSFTSLRIAASIAKGIALGANVPLYAVSSLALIVASSQVPAGKYLATLDALRDEWYVGLCVRTNAGTVDEVEQPVRVARADLDRFAASVGATVIGAATDGAQPHASGCLGLRDCIERTGPVDLDGWEPAYGRLAEAQVKWEATHGRALGE